VHQWAAWQEGAEEGQTGRVNLPGRLTPYEDEARGALRSRFKEVGRQACAARSIGATNAGWWEVPLRQCLREFKFACGRATVLSFYEGYLGASPPHLAAKECIRLKPLVCEGGVEKSFVCTYRTPK